MPRNHTFFRVTAVALLTCFIHLTALPTMSLAQAPDCQYDRAKPSLDSARINFKSLNYKCAEQEILDALSQGALSIEEKADAHVLLAAVYYAMLKNDSQKRNRVIEQFKAAFQAYREWRGELDISSSEFIDLMTEAQKQVDKEALQLQTPPPPPVEQPKDTARKAVAPPPPAAAPKVAEGGGKPLYTKWWAILLGVGLVAGAVVLATGGGGDGGGETTLDTLGTIPNPPVGKR